VVSKTVEELEAAWHAASEREKEASQRWLALAAAAREANLREDEAFAAWNVAAAATFAAFDALYGRRLVASADSKGDA